MAPVRRYLRISKYSVLECRIYLDNPALAQSWLLNPRNPILPRVIESIRPLVLPKLREERERERLRKKSTKKKQVKDVVVQDDFEVSIFLTETSTRHSLLFKNKHFREKQSTKMASNSTKLISETDSVPFNVDETEAVAVLQEEEEDERATCLADIPMATGARRSKRQRRPAYQEDESESGDDETASPINIDSDTEAPPSKRQKDHVEANDDFEDDKKKLAMDVSYDGFAIYGSVLCLVVKKRDGNKTTQARGKASGGQQGSGIRPEGQAMMENWITSTQIPVGEDVA